MSLTSLLIAIVNFVIFDAGDAHDAGKSQGSSIHQHQGTVAVDELLYIFQIAYQLLNRITDLDLIKDPYVKGGDGGAKKPRREQDQEGQFGCQAELELVESLYGKVPDGTEVVEAKQVIMKISVNEEIQRFFQIFQYGKISDADLEEMISGQPASKPRLAGGRRGASGLGADGGGKGQDQQPDGQGQDKSKMEPKGDGKAGQGKPGSGSSGKAGGADAQAASPEEAKADQEKQGGSRLEAQSRTSQPLRGAGQQDSGAIMKLKSTARVQVGVRANQNLLPSPHTMNSVASEAFSM